MLAHSLILGLLVLYVTTSSIDREQILMFFPWKMEMISIFRIWKLCSRSLHLLLCRVCRPSFSCLSKKIYNYLLLVILCSESAVQHFWALHPSDHVICLCGSEIVLHYYLSSLIVPSIALVYVCRTETYSTGWL